jgi:ABC-type protease/lipase transport system fused ATPase/permease subunit
LDTPGDDALIAAIQTAKQWGSTVILVTHNTRMLRPVDKIMILYEGRKQTLGPRAEVLQALRPKPVNITKPAEVGESKDTPNLRPVPAPKQGA